MVILILRMTVVAQKQWVGHNDTLLCRHSLIFSRVVFHDQASLSHSQNLGVSIISVKCDIVE